MKNRTIKMDGSITGLKTEGKTAEVKGFRTSTDY